MKQLIALLLLPFVACAPAPNAANVSSTPGSAETVSARTYAVQPVGINATSSRVQGRVEIQRQLDGRTQITLSLQGLVANSVHAVHLHAGSCAQPGAIRLALTEAVASTVGNHNSSTTFDTTRMPSSAYVMVHERASNAPTGPGPGMACANLR
jgi:hypothetical protein